MLREEAEGRLRALAGEHARLREDQWAAIKALVMDRRRVLVVQRTGWGKSAVYFIATALLRELGEGPTVIVSPLLALMRNQIAAAERAGINAVTINSANPEEWEQIYGQVAEGMVDVLLVSPERLNNPDFRDQVLPELAESAGLVVVDEAHCISDWGHDFRPDYRRLRTMFEELPEGVPILATTATANARVTHDVAEQMGEETLVLRGALERESLHLGVVRLRGAEQRLAWLAQTLHELPGSGIIYTLTVAAAQEIAAYLREQGHEVAAYSGQTEQAERLAAEQALLDNKIKALVATSALGMGYDKPDLGFVVHVGAPQSPVAYYQQVGRAGRGVERAEVILLPGAEDREIWAYFASLAFPPEPVVRTVLAALEEGGVLSTAALENRVDLSRTRLETMLKVLDVDGAVRRVKGGWEATGEAWGYDADRYARVAAEREAEQRAMLDYLDSTECREMFLRHRLDDDTATPCGRCDNCTGAHRSPEVEERAVERAAESLHRPGVEVEARKQWPTGLTDLKGRIKPELGAEPGRALGRLTDIGWGNRLRGLLAEGAPDGPVPDDVFAAVVKVLSSWEWTQRPIAVVAMPSAGRPQLVRSLAERLAQVGRLSYLGDLGYRSGPPGRQFNSAQRVQAIRGTLAMPSALGAAIAGAGGPVLLVDDRVDTGWSMTLAAAMIRHAGAPAVLPLALAVTS
ncbi:RecQ family ATP-dependent DNA helicase [Streptosporangium roseum]|uniref:ATP-dependent DNA helicase RecQ n=1 Tax=Streptosporangium roseum (strain ATCC 12428 / DSM 43021 / JCM 3005 / KCTC 9067 / NCIMB 10171 / NRRL 2505 / NI 9100) TaxID=479432 RepID=D2B916_STRRD|nr:RecQ family ATP-dependent DNA helicase [Streptosporangium roseum]ACZ89772.1 ATP-dependent DNA helicase RecQ [Streptosporangium roseum DSM 43021]